MLHILPGPRVQLAFCSLLATASFASGAIQQTTGEPQGKAYATPSPPIIDGDLSDAVWQNATPLSPLTEVTPNQGAVPKDATVIRVLFDSEAIYFGIRCFDSEPGKLINTTMERDGYLDADDRIEMVIDTFYDRRNAFYFQVNPAGSKSDALITGNGQSFNKPWDGIWQCKTRTDRQGWTAEFSIPFKTLSFDEQGSTWGFNLERVVGRRNEVQRWAHANQDYRLQHIYQAGKLTGLHGMRQGLGLDVTPFLVGRFLDARGDLPDEGFDADAGLDAFFKITPNLTASLTINTDFAETEVDQRQVNLTRFPLFFPERRDFFLQDSGVFNFANLGSDLLPFFSRTIGLAGGQQVPIDLGFKLTGRVGDYSLGLLDVLTDETDTLDDQNLFAARISRDVGQQSTIGAIVTRGNPADTGDNTLMGLDGNFRTNDFLGHRQLSANVWGLVSNSEGQSEKEGAFGLSLDSREDLWSWGVEWAEIQENFHPAMGFVPRTGIRRYEAYTAYRPRPATDIRQYSFELDAEFITSTDDSLQSSEIEWQAFGAEWESGDELHVEITQSEERLDADFQIRDGITIPADDYRYLDYRIEFESAAKRQISYELRATQGDFFDGERLSTEARLTWQPGPGFSTSFEYEHNDISLEAGDFVADLARLRFTRSFSPDLTWANLVQWDSESNTFGLNSRLRWIQKPGREVFVVFNHSVDDQNGSFDRVFQEFAFKLVYTLRF